MTRGKEFQHLSVQANALFEVGVRTDAMMPAFEGCCEIMQSVRPVRIARFAVIQSFCVPSNTVVEISARACSIISVAKSGGKVCRDAAPVWMLRRTVL